MIFIPSLLEDLQTSPDLRPDLRKMPKKMPRKAKKKESTHSMHASTSAF